MCTYTSSRVKRKGFYGKSELHMFLLFDTFLGRFPEVNILSKHIVLFFNPSFSSFSQHHTTFNLCLRKLVNLLVNKGLKPGAAELFKLKLDYDNLGLVQIYEGLKSSLSLIHFVHNLMIGRLKKNTEKLSEKILLNKTTTTSFIS